jgi:V8-like Glu-specific endopeptidase
MFSRLLSLRAVVLLLAAATALVSISIPSAAEAPAERYPPQRVVERSVRGSGAAITRYWTRARMRHADPLDLVVDSKRQAQAAVTAEPDGPPGQVAGVAPASSALVNGATASMAARTSSGPFPYSRYEITTPEIFPFSASGKVFFRMGGGNYVCSATALASENKSAVITAGHCVNDGAGGPWATNWTFAPGYRNGVAPYGVWAADSLHTTTGWLSQANLRYDIGAAIIRPNTSGQLLVDVVGGRGIAWNQSTAQFFRSFGYPAGAPFDGSKLFVCDANYGSVDATVPGSGPHPIGIGCDMTGGSSGGGWVIQDSFVNSVNSYKIFGQNEVMYGPYFGSAAETIYNAVRGPAVTPSPSPSPTPGTPSPSPSPSPSPTPTPTPSPSPTPTPEEPTTHKVTVTLELVRKLIAKGSMTTVDGYKPCTRNAPIKVQRRAAGRWNVIKTVYTNDFGRYRAKVSNQPGRYRVVSPKGGVDDLNLCSAATSAVRRAR